MTRSTSSLTLPIFANDSTSAPVSFGLLSTADATSLLGSRINWARCSRVPLKASLTLRLDREAGQELRLDWRRRRRRHGIDQRLIVLVGRFEQRRRRVGGRHRSRFDPEIAEELLDLRRRVGTGEVGTKRFDRERPHRRLDRRRHLAVGVVGHEQEERELLVSGAHQPALGREQPHLAGRVAAPELIDQWRTVTGIHSGRRL